VVLSDVAAVWRHTRPHADDQSVAGAEVDAGGQPPVVKRLAEATPVALTEPNRTEPAVQTAQSSGQSSRAARAGPYNPLGGRGSLPAGLSLNLSSGCPHRDSDRHAFYA